MLHWQSPSSRVLAPHEQFTTLRDPYQPLVPLARVHSSLEHVYVRVGASGRQSPAREHPDRVGVCRSMERGGTSVCWIAPTPKMRQSTHVIVAATSTQHLNGAPGPPRLCGSLTVGLLVAGTSRGTAELLGLAAARVSDEEGSVVLEEDLLDLVLLGLVNVCRTRRSQAPRTRTARGGARGSPSARNCVSHCLSQDLKLCATSLDPEAPPATLTLLVVGDHGLGDGLTDGCGQRG